VRTVFAISFTLQGDVSPAAELALDKLYATALESVGGWEDPDFVMDFQAIMGVVLVAGNPLSASAVD